MRIMQITAFSGWGCTGRITLGIHNMLVSEGHESMIAWGRINTAPEDVPNIKIGNKFDRIFHGIYTRITDKCGFASKAVTEEFLRKVDEYKPDLIHLHIIHGYYINLEVLFNYIKSHNIPIVWTLHDCWAFTGHCPYFDCVKCEKWKTGCNACPQKQHHPSSLLMDNSEWNWRKKKELFTGIKNLTVVTPSEWLADLVKQSFLKEYPVKVINNGVNLEYFKPTQSSFKTDYDLENKKIVLGVSSSWAKSKGLDDFIELSKHLPADYKIVLVGLGKRQIKQLPKNILGIEYTDSINKLAEIYTVAEVFVNPTYEDNYPTVNLESMACGTPVITYDTGGSVEVVLTSGFGVITEAGNIEKLRDAVVNIKNLSVKCDREKIIKLCQQKISFVKYCELYNKAINTTAIDKNNCSNTNK